MKKKTKQNKENILEKKSHRYKTVLLLVQFELPWGKVYVHDIRQLWSASNQPWTLSKLNHLILLFYFIIYR